MRALIPDGGTDDPLSVYAEAARPAPDGRPWVLANMVAGLDGAVTVDGRVGPLSSDTDKELFRRLRGLADVILVGAGTVRAEGYGPARPSSARRQARRDRGQSEVAAIAVVTATLQLDWSAPFFTEAEARPIVITCSASDADARARAGEVADVVVAGDERVDLGVALGQLRQTGTSIVLTEGGPTLNAGLLAAAALDELCLTLAPLVGGDPGGIVAADGAGDLTAFRLESVLEEDGHLFLRYLRATGHG